MPGVVGHRSRATRYAIFIMGLQPASVLPFTNLCRYYGVYIFSPETGHLNISFIAVGCREHFCFKLTSFAKYLASSTFFAFNVEIKHFLAIYLCFDGIRITYKILFIFWCPAYLNIAKNGQMKYLIRPEHKHPR